MNFQFVRKVDAGSFVFREGDPGDCAYIIEKGTIQILIKKNGTEVSVETLGPGDIFGEVAIVDDLPRTASAKAIEACELSVISRERLQQRVNASDPIIRLVIYLLLKRIRSSNRMIKGNVINHQSEFSRKITNLSEAHDRLKLENDLLSGLEKNEFILEYQPILELKTRTLVGFEALIRWHNLERGRVGPDLFIDAAEETSVIIPMGEWILHKGFEDFKKLQTGLGRDDLFMSLNVSMQQLKDPEFVKRLAWAQKKTKVNPKQIKLEMTERVLQEDPAIFDTIEQVRALGYVFSLDDFGTEYASLTSLFNLKVDNIKIDRSFISNFLTDRKSKAIVQAVIAMASELGLVVIAEGIEKEEEALLLTTMGCALGQGFLFSKSKSVVDLIAIFKKNKKAAA